MRSGNKASTGLMASLLRKESGDVREGNGREWWSAREVDGKGGGGGQRLKAIVGRQMKTLSHPFLFC